MPRLDGARALGAEALAERTVIARWCMGDDTQLVIAVNLGDDAAATPALGVGRCLHETRVGVAVAAEWAPGGAQRRRLASHQPGGGNAERIIDTGS